MSPAPRPGAFILDRWQVLQLVKDTSRALGLGEREIAVLAAHLSVLPKGPVRANQLLMSYAEIGGLLERANCMDERRFRRGEARLAEIGLVTRKLSGNGRRYPVRDGRGQIVDAYGIDLRPLFLRAAELEEIRTRLAEEDARRRALRSRISARLSALRREGAEAALPCLDALQRLCRRARASLCELAAAERQLDAAEAGLEQATSDPAPQPDRQAAIAGHSVRSKESPEKETIKPARESDIWKLWQASPRLAAYFPDPLRDRDDLLRRILDFLGFLGVKGSSAVEALARIPIPDMLRLLEMLLGRLSRIDNPAAYLRSMLANYDGPERGSARNGRQYDRGHNRGGLRLRSLDRACTP